MNIYFLVEGQSSEADVYPAWLSYLIPELTRVTYFNEVDHNNYYLFSSNGIPYIEKDIVNAAMDINDFGRDSIGGEVVSTTSFVLANRHNPFYKGDYIRLVDGNSEAEKSKMFRGAIA